MKISRPSHLTVPALILGSATLLLAGCSSLFSESAYKPLSVDVLHLESDPALRGGQIEQERVAILPAMASTPMIEATELAAVREQLAERLAKSRPRLGLVEGARVDGALRDHPELKPALQKFTRTLAMSREDLTALSGAVGARYVVFVVFDEYSFGWGSREIRYYPGLIALGLAKSSKYVTPVAVDKRGVADTRLVGTLSIFNASEGRPVWIGAAMVRQISQESTAFQGVPGAERPTGIGTPKPPEPTKLSPHFFEALVDLWPS